MFDRRTAIGKMINYNKAVFQCRHCPYNFVGNKDTKITQCPQCKHEDCFVIRGDWMVVK